MGNCAIKPKVLKDSDKDLIPVERETAAPAEKNETIALNTAEEAAVAAKRSEKGKDILIEDDVVDEHKEKRSRSHLFHEEKPVAVKEVLDLSPTKQETNNKTSSLSVSKLDTSDLTPTNTNAPEETFDVQTRNDLEVKIPKDSEVKTPETPKANEAEKKEVNFSDNWEVKFPEESETKKTSKVAEESKLPGVSAPALSDIKVTKETDVPQLLEDKNIHEDSSKVSASELSEMKVTKEYDVPQLLEDKNIQEDSSKVSASELSEMKVTKEFDVPQVLEDKSKVSAPEVSEIKVGKEYDVPQLLEDKNIEVSSKVSAPGLFEMKVGKEYDVPQLLEDKNTQEVSSKVSAPELSSETKFAKESDVSQVLEDKNTDQLSGIKFTKESDVPEVLEDKNITEVKTDDVKVAESDLLKVSEVRSTEDLEIQVPKVFEAKTSQTLNDKVTDESKVKTDEESLKAKIAEDVEAPAEFVDAKEKIEKSEQDTEILLPKSVEEEKDRSSEKQDKESTLSDLGTK